MGGRQFEIGSETGNDEVTQLCAEESVLARQLKTSLEDVACLKQSLSQARREASVAFAEASRAEAFARTSEQQTRILHDYARHARQRIETYAGVSPSSPGSAVSFSPSK